MKIFESINPFNNEVVGSYQTISSETVQKKIAIAAKSFKHWRQESFARRGALMHQFADKLLLEKSNLATTIALEMGKVLKEAEAEIEKSAMCCRYYANNAESFLKNENMPSSAQKSYVRYDPVGGILAIMPWNFPVWQVIRFAAPYLMAGNVALLKHAPNVCGVAVALERIFLESGFPEGIFQSLIIDVDIVPEIIDSSFIQGITLTGSEYAGSQVAAEAGRAIKKTVLELGGSDAFIVCEDADIAQAAQTGWQSRMQNAGQSCIAAKRFILVGGAYDTFIDAFIEESKKVNLGDQLKATTTMGPLARIDLAEKLEKQLEESVRTGAKILTGGKRDNCLFEPTILTGVEEGMPAFEQELFGPVANVIQARNVEEAVELANASRYGLGSAIWTKDTEQAQVIAGKIEAGSVFINAMVKSDPRYPFGGVKKSGYGRELSYFGIREFMNIKTVYVNE